MYPSINYMEKHLNISREIAQKIRKVFLDSTNYHNYNIFVDNADKIHATFPSVYSWLASCHHLPSNEEIKLEMINVLLKGHGTEILSEENWGNFRYPHYSYVNMGDPYITTILYDYKKECFICSCWGNIAENFNEGYDDRKGPYTYVYKNQKSR